MRVVDDAVLSATSGLGFDVHDGVVLTDPITAPVIIVGYDVPYAVYYSNIGDDGNRRLDGRESRRSVFFSFTYVGLDRRQAKWAGERLRDALQGRRIAVTGHRSFLCDLIESQRIRRDDDAIRPDGSPLFYGVDNYAVSITLQPLGG